MLKKTKIALVIAAVLMLSGLILLAVFEWNTPLVTTTYNIDKDFIMVIVNADTADVVFRTSDDGTCRVVCSEYENEKHNVFRRDNGLWIATAQKEQWYEYLRIRFAKPKITVYLPQEEYNWLSIDGSTGDVEVAEGISFTNVDIYRTTGDVSYSASASRSMKMITTTGDIRVENVTTGNLELSASTGDIMLLNVTCTDADINVSTGDVTAENFYCQNLISNGSTGDITLKNAIAGKSFYITRSTGDVCFDGSDAEEITVKTDTGDISGTLLSEKHFYTSTGTGSVDIPQTFTGGYCEFTTDTGDIKIGIQ